MHSWVWKENRLQYDYCNDSSADAEIKEIASMHSIITIQGGGGTT